MYYASRNRTMILLSAIALFLSMLLVVFGLPYLESEWRNYYFNRIKWKTQIKWNQFKVIDDFFSSRFTYYRRLNAEGKAKFIYRAMEFKQHWIFEGREDLEVSEHMEMLVCGAAAQLTYGLDYFLLESFEKIILYPSTFYSKIINAEVKGLTYGSGVIALSWKDFETGFRINNDGYNLALHELAHALDINNEKAFKKDKLNELYFTDFIDTSFWEYRQASKEISNILDSRAKRNEHEFFAVCVEHFFECPELFLEKLPEVFHHLCLLLQQNPLNIHANYALDDQFTAEARNAGMLNIPRPIRWINKSRTPVSQAFFSLAMIPGLYSYIHLSILNPQHSELINWCLFIGGLIFTLMRSRISFLANKWSLLNSVLYFNFIRGALLCSFIMFVLNSSLWHSNKNLRYHLRDSAITCRGEFCSLKDSPLFDFPVIYYNLKYYSFHHSELEMYKAGSIPLYLEERTERGLFNLILSIDMRIVAGTAYYPARIRD
ncbi:MAG: hypothetical protein GC180_08690 [Bacteroidetes bacterium]|nr:hypothetical protein [Bacteroidota bacterium]